MAAFLSLAACDGLPLPGGGDDASAAAERPATGPLSETDIEAPEVFQVTEAGLWDGRPSLGGVWVAHPEVAEPERVIIRNTESGEDVIGALFRRERETPGPALQVSSDAAEALGILAGDPTELSVTALRRAEAPDTAPDAAAPPQAVPVGAEGALAAPPEVSATALAPAGAPSSPAPSAPPTPPAGAIERPYLQIGLFSVEENARSAAAQLEGAGLAAQVERNESQDRTFWRVLAGPAATQAERDAALERVIGLGYADAYPVGG